MHPQMHAATTTRACCAALVAAAGLLLGGCSAPVQPPAATAPDPTATSIPSVSTALDWTSSVCAGLQPVVAGLTAPPEPNLSDLAGTRQAYLDYLGVAQQRADQALQLLDAVGPPPVPDGDRIGAQTREQLTQMRTDIGQARDQLQQADPNNPISMGYAVTSTANVFASLASSAQALAKLKENPDLGPAFAQAPSCEPFRRFG